MSLDELRSEFLTAKQKIESANSVKDLESIRIYYLGKSGVLTFYLKKIALIDNEEDRKAVGSQVNSICSTLKSEIATKRSLLINEEITKKLRHEAVDLSLPVRPQLIGKVHVLSKTINEIKDIFSSIGFELAYGPEIENEYYVFDALNTPDHHPARQSQDTFYIKGESENKKILLRTHTSSVQIRTMEKNNIPPIKIIAPGKVYRNDWDATHTPMFHQVEGLYIDKNIHMGHLKYCINYFLSAFFNKKVNTRFRGSFFPFTEPSIEVDLLCKNDKWLEVLGCGLVHPSVLKNVDIDSSKYTGFAFGIGIERMAMLKYGITDLRDFYSNKINWLNHYGFCFYDLKV